ncbi:alternative ribosome rescue aminoacyl-tRNA hydrolase ArfB [Alkalitalea saponilacus]|uniref:Ribosome-associated protein n=1 Tax=Alkalitalea saponilacus TaxID=889453 RepID=A0A1T5H7U2_9BACT|nr:alternative ribosome rescue aminoacyl-tRNA hydrolase ArfB [Alkalitalea saponilacus]ASB50851.1 aminoacyl-tRNA hydrolase [Alkalitalea saponilacus]SKC16742.1 ribosome-associated protein [Alkalitalea saponilacus]
MNNIRNRNFISEIGFIATRSSGPGGQHVNKVSSKIELRFSISESSLLTPEEKERILWRLKNRINNKGEIIITAQEERSQLKNKILAIEKFYQLIEGALKTNKARKATKPTQSSIAKRILNKKITGEKKRLRKKDFL